MIDEKSSMRELEIQFMENLAPGGILIATPLPDFKVIYANSRLLDMFQVYDIDHLNSILGKNSLALVHSDDLAALKESRRNHEENNHSPAFRVRRGDGTYLWVEEILQYKNLSDGQKVVAAFYADVSAYKEAEQRLRDINQEMSAIYNNIPGGAFQCKFNADWDVLFANDGLFKFLGYTREEFAAMGNKMSSVIYEEDKAPMIPILQK